MRMFGKLVFLFLVLLGSIAAGERLITPKNKENCSYIVTIETTCVQGAGTSNYISLKFGDANSNDIVIKHLNSKHIRKVDSLDPKVLDDVPRKPFQACLVDKFHIKGQCMKSPICYLYLKSAGNNDWRPGFAQIRVLELGYAKCGSGLFYFRRYLPRNVWYGMDLCDKEVTPFGIKHRRKILLGKDN